MKQLLYALLAAATLAACNAADEAETAAAPEAAESAPQPAAANLRPIDSEEALVATALMALPEPSRADARVIGYNLAGEFVTLKEGTNEFICLADDPAQDGFNASCYHKDLEPFMARGRALKAEGKDAAAIFEIREAEVKAGQLSMGAAGATLHVYAGPQALYNPETKEVAGARHRYVVYMPFATAESTGLPEKPIAPNYPWIMDPGTHRAHIMITPAADGEE